MLTREQFTEHLRDALDHLYDPDQLSRSPLVLLFELSDRVDISFALQNTLIEAIETLEPEATVPVQSRAWRLYELLVCRYLQQLRVQEVADQLGISRRHLRREQNAALKTLTYRLWNQFNLDSAALDKSYDDESGTAKELVGASTTVEGELSWLKNLTPGKSTDLGETLSDVLELVSSLAACNRVNLKMTVGPELPNPAVHPVAVRQLLLSLLTFAIEHLPGGSLNLMANAGQWNVKIRVVATGRSAREVAAQHRLGQSFKYGLKPTPSNEPTGLAVVQRIADVVGGGLTVSSDENTFAATVTFPALEQLPVLVIDDNADTLALLQRYTKGTQYCLIGEQNPGNAVRVAEQVSPQVIVLDVMMPDIDGWEVLGRLRENPLTRHIPIFVCTILAVEGLAISLGANACIRKPVTQTAFLAALDQQLASQAIEPR